MIGLPGCYRSALRLRSQRGNKRSAFGAAARFANWRRPTLEDTTVLVLQVAIRVVDDTQPRWKRGNSVDISDALCLANALVVSENEGVILANWAAGRRAKLIALERRNRGWVEKVPSIQGAVTQELISRPVERVRSRA